MVHGYKECIDIMLKITPNGGKCLLDYCFNKVIYSREKVPNTPNLFTFKFDEINARFFFLLLSHYIFFLNL